MIAVSPQGEILFWNSAAESLFGYARTEAEHRSLYDLVVPPDRVNEARNAIERALRTGEESFESVRRKKDGSLIAVEVSMRAIHNGTGAAEYLVIGKRDITRRKQIEAKLLASEARYRRIVETAAEGIWTIDANDRTNYINRRGADILGFAAEELTGCSPLEFVFEEDTADAGRELRLRREGRQLEGDIRMRRKDGTEVWIHSVTTPILSDDGCYQGSLAMFTDITAHKRAYDAILKLSSIVQHSNDAIISESLDGTIQSWNAGAARIYGYSAEEVIGKPVSLLIPPDRYHEPFEFLRRIKRGDLVEHYTTVRRRKDGKHIDVSQTISPIRDAENTITGVSVISREITQERLLREQLDNVVRQRAEDLQRFVSSVQHAQEEERQRISRELHDDLGQRLTGLKLKIEVLEDDIAHPLPGVTDGLTQVKRDIDAMITEIRRISSNLRPAALDDFGIVVAVQLLCKEFEKSAGVRVDFQSDMVQHQNKQVEIALYRIAQEALANTMRHAHATTVSVRLWEDEQNIGLAVEDDGIGFDLSALQARDSGSGGLGLISMRERAQQFGGSLYLTSSLHRGTKVQVEIPARGAHDHGKNQDTRRG